VVEAANRDVRDGDGVYVYENDKKPCGRKVVLANDKHDPGVVIHSCTLYIHTSYPACNAFVSCLYFLFSSLGAMGKIVVYRKSWVFLYAITSFHYQVTVYIPTRDALFHLLPMHMQPFSIISTVHDQNPPPFLPLTALHTLSSPFFSASPALFSIFHA
jgi:hypothetical protein